MSGRRRQQCALFLACAIIMMLEIVFFHVLIYIKNYLEATSVISVALMGIALGGIGGLYIFRSRKPALLSYISVGTGISIVICILNLIFFPQLLKYPLLLVLPFVGLGSIVSYCFIELKTHMAYFCNLAGAAFGVILIWKLVPAVHSENVFLIIIALCAIVGIVLSVPIGKRKLAMLLSILILFCAVVACIWNIYAGTFDFAKNTHPSPTDRYKIFNYYHRHKDKAEILYSKDNLVARVDIFHHKRYKRSYETFQEGVISDNVTSFPVRSFFWGTRIPNKLITDPRILVIGPSAEGVTKNAKCISKGNMVAVELNPAIVDLMRNELFEFSRRAYENVAVYVMDARTYMESTREKFDLITLLNTHTRGRVTENVGIPQYLFTDKSFSLMFDHLTERGALIVEEIRINEYSDFFIRKVVACIIAGLKKTGVKDYFQHHFYAYSYVARGFKFYIIIVKKNPFNAVDIERMDSWFAVKKQKYLGPLKDFKLVIHPGKDVQSPLAEFVRHPDEHIRNNLANNGLDLNYISDDRPFLFDFDTRHPEIRRIFLLSVLSMLVFVLLPVMILFFSSFREKIATASLHIVYFSILGLAYMLVEIVIMQKYQLFLGSPVYALVVVLLSLFVFSGLGSLAAQYFSDTLKNLAVCAIPVILIIFCFTLGALFEYTQMLALPLKVIISLGSLFPLFFCMGVPFPYGLSLVKKTFSKEYVTLLYGINGASGTVGVTLSLMLSVYYGLRMTFYLGIGLYLTAFCLICFMLCSKKMIRAGN